MDRYLNFDRGNRVLIDRVEHVFDGCVAAVEPGATESLVFIDSRIGLRVVFTRVEFDLAYSAGRFKFVKAYEKVVDVAPETDASDHGIA
ncbi:MAG: hypothetical protein EON87_03645, partial [Brevundimonas sp.]